jgi:hypothetical protein
MFSFALIGVQSDECAFKFPAFPFRPFSKNVARRRLPP